MRSYWGKASNRFDFVFSAYCGAAALILTLLARYFAEEADSRCRDFVKHREAFGCNFDGMISDHAWVYEIFTVIGVFVVFFFIYRVFKARSPLGKGIMSFILFTIWGLTAIPIAGSSEPHTELIYGLNFGLLKITVYWWIIFGLVIGLIDAVNGMRPDLSIVQSQVHSESVKIARIQQEHSKWTSATSLVVTIYITVVLSVIIAFVFGVNEFVRYPYMFAYTVIIIVSAFGLAFGVLKDFAGKISSVNGALLKLERPTD